MSHINRIEFAWSACIFFAGMHNFLKINPATCNKNKYGISWQSCNLIRPDNNNGYNIKLSTSKENLPKELSNFPSVFEINNVVKEFSSAMKHILCSLGIKINQEDFSSLIQQSICSLKKNNNDEILLEGINNNINISTEEEIEEVDLLESDINQLDDIDILLNKHQQRLLGRSNLSNLNFTNLNQIYDEEIHLDLESEKKYDYYTQQEKRKIGNKAMLNKKNLTVVTELETMDITTAIRYDRLNSNEQQIRTKGRIARWKTAFFEKYGSSYVRVDLLDGSNEGRIHARLYDLKLDSDQEFVPIISSNRAQFVCESNIFRFIACLGSVLEEYHSNSYWLEKILKLRDLQYTTYFHFVEKSCELEQSIKEAERIMKSKKT
ncbi:18682_t:CDS:2, partial [Gigaspora rosea]